AWPPALAVSPWGLVRSEGLGPGVPGRLLDRLRRQLPGGVPQQALADGPERLPRLPTRPSSRPVGGQASRSERPLPRSARAVPRNVRRSITQTPPQRRKMGTTNGRPAVKTCPVTPGLEGVTGCRPRGPARAIPSITSMPGDRWALRLRYGAPEPLLEPRRAETRIRPRCDPAAAHHRPVVSGLRIRDHRPLIPARGQESTHELGDGHRLGAGHLARGVQRPPDG